MYVHSTFEVIVVTMAGAISPYGTTPNYAPDVNSLNFDLMVLCTYPFIYRSFSQSIKRPLFFLL